MKSTIAKSMILADSSADAAILTGLYYDNSRMIFDKSWKNNPKFYTSVCGEYCFTLKTEVYNILWPSRGSWRVSHTVSIHNIVILYKKEIWRAPCELVS